MFILRVHAEEYENNHSPEQNKLFSPDVSQSSRLQRLACSQICRCPVKGADLLDGSLQNVETLLRYLSAMQVTLECQRRRIAGFLRLRSPGCQVTFDEMNTSPETTTVMIMINKVGIAQFSCLHNLTVA